tara:strand:+ start:1865 stop:1981 length:117 start_codon:yes stop_codon:yes gene_type:complete
MLRNLLAGMLLDKRNIDLQKLACGDAIMKELLTDGHRY